MKLKVCGMKYPDNMLEVASVGPDYMGFIFWEPSSRFFNTTISEIPNHIKKVGVFVDASLEEIINTIKRYNLQAVQLHGKESPDFCKQLKGANKSEINKPKREVEIIKVFSIKDDFNFGQLQAYEAVCDYFLFDTKGKLPGGNGYVFSWEVLKEYPSKKPYFLSGGIGLEETDKLKDFLQRPESKYCYAIDVNSKFETAPGLKEIEKLKEFKKSIE
ncbi:N-(5'-phosphoribosyl)anthranilate isomerase [Arenibacter antarcticus]|uniref:N-(5'-phosphoribosyl)anthranilate isomerase n=1 Tax=Arenibacter antarcticus TaxID=2040469 RepID=A0ABW5VIZ8_9FLAO|nr:phosphoribosylanthranilate isomerase [Arenibacter sp. H213]MCM4169685.1 N-(5'-phosphoribosyl)anthranilate isomerase [Arenibacter sp. H213]